MAQRQCANCKSYKFAQLPSSNPFVLIFQMIGGSGCLMMAIGIFFWPLIIIALPLMILGGAVSGIITLLDLDPGARIKCKNCGMIIYLKPEKARDKK